VAVARVARELGVPVWLRVHGSDRFHLTSSWRRHLILDAAEYARGVICNAKPVADYLVKKGIPKAKIHIVPNGVDSEVFKYRSVEEMADYRHQTTDHRLQTHPGVAESVRIPTVQDELPGGIPTNAATGLGVCRTNSPVAESVRIPTGPCILFIANLVPVKGPDVMIRAFARMVNGYSLSVIGDGTDNREPITNTQGGKPTPCPSKEGSNQGLQDHPVPLPGGVRGGFLLAEAKCVPPSTNNPCLLIIGSGSMRKAMERLAEGLGVGDHVHFLGNRPHAEVALWMNRADVLCLTSRSEGMPNVVVEALASGLPVVATDVGACREMLEGEPAARLCQSGDVAGIARALAEVLAMKVDRQAMAATYAGKYSWQKAAETIAGLMGSGNR